MQHGKDFVWMQRGTEPPEKVAIDHSKAAEMTEILSQKMAAGYLQVDPPTETEKGEMIDVHS